MALQASQGRRRTVSTTVFGGLLVQIAISAAGDALHTVPPPVQQFLPGNVPTKGAAGQPGLAPPTPRLAYTAGDGLYVMPLGMPAVRIDTFVDLSRARPQQDYATDLVWSADGRYLAWSQQLMDDPGHDDEARADRLVTLTILDTETRHRRVWVDDAAKVSSQMRGTMVFVQDRLAIWSADTLVLAGMGEDPHSVMPYPAVRDSHLVGATDDALIVRHASADVAGEQFLRIGLDGENQPIGTVSGHVVGASYDAPTGRFVLALRDQHSDCDWADTIATANHNLTEIAELQLPRLPVGQRWHASPTSFQFAADGSVDALLTHDHDPCGSTTTQTYLHQHGDDLRADPAFTDIGPTTKIATSFNGYRIFQPGSPVSDHQYMGSSELTVIDPSGRRSTVELADVGKMWAISAVGSSGGSPKLLRAASPRPRIDAGNMTYRTTCGNISTAPFEAKLRDGKGEVALPNGKNYSLAVSAVTTGDLTGDDREETAVILHCMPSNANFQGWDVHVYGGNDGKRLASIVVDPLPDALYPSVDWAKNELSIRARRLEIGVMYYGPNDCHACGPSIHRALSWRWNGSRLVQA